MTEYARSGFDAGALGQSGLKGCLLASNRSRWFNLNNPYAYRDDNLRALGFASYSAYLNSELWAAIRAKVLESQPICFKCAKKKATQVHHRCYDKATMRGENLNSLTALCGACHRRAERPDDFSVTRYDRYKAAGEVMFKRSHPTLRARALRRRASLNGTGR